MKRGFILTLGIMLAPATAPSAEPKSPPNIILILADDK